ncbi:hypothetical protein CRG98_001208 [Punica granatum]|uniref:Uncharacterized protein n=1 Tax=Punica granatum TaxID=22663 RepID=A0A2I0LCI4_PUNGR|nr:hypothetical protein CRG98_001208 [Punica granatum]
MYEGKSRGSGRESRETRLGATGQGTREEAAAAVSGKRVGTLTPVTARCKTRAYQGLNKPENVRESSVKMRGTRESLGGWSHRPWVLAEARCGQAVAWRVEPWLGVEPRLDGLAWPSYFECLNDEDLNEPNIAMHRVNGRSGDSAPRECSGIVVISVFRGRTPKARRETFMTTKTSLGKPSRASEGPFWGPSACQWGGPLRALSEKASVRDRGVPAQAGCPGNAPGRVFGHFGTKRDF